MSLPIDIHKLLNGRVIEWDRLEFKTGWNPEDVVHTMCAFANDMNNWGGGYIIIGVKEINGIPQFPAVGLQDNQIDRIQKELVSLCQQMEPKYIPVTEPVIYQDRLLFIIWVAGGDKRPYKAPVNLGKKDAKRVYIRQGSVTKLASSEEERFLNTISIALPFDDRVNKEATINDLDKDLIIEFLYAAGSNLYKEATSLTKEELAMRMQLLRGAPEDRHPVNVALLFFSPEPHKFFRGAYSEVVLYSDEKGITFSEKTFRGSFFKQIREVLQFLRNMVLMERVIKIEGQAEALRIWNYPYEALEEAVVNAFYHRSYENVNPIEISVYPDKIVILSFPGPLPPIDKNMLKSRKVFARDYRNRRIGDFLKELDLSEGRGTGFPIIYSQMEENGSPAPIFETDEKFTHFLTVLPVNQSVASLIKEEELYNQGKEDAQKVVTEEESEEKTTEKGVEKGKENTTENGKRKTTEKTTEKSVEKTTENGVEISKENTTENGKRKTTEKIIHLMKENPKISQEAIAEILGITSDGVFWNIKQLKVRGIIQRIGADRGGYWKVIKK